MSETIEMVVCPYCNENYVSAENMFCENCAPKLKVDMSIVSLANETNELWHTPLHRIRPYKKHLTGIINQLKEIVEKL